MTKRLRRDGGRAAVLAVVVIFGVVVGLVFVRQRQTRLAIAERAAFEQEAERARTQAREQRLSGFKDKAPALFALATAATEQLEATPVLHGKLVVLKKDESGRGEVDSVLQLEVDQKRAATNAEEVGTIIIVERGTEVAGKYEKTGSTGYRRTCDLTLVDAARKVVFARKRLTGDEPDASIRATSNHDVYGSDPTTTVVAWIDSLPPK